jgi:hypothetical protein
MAGAQSVRPGLILVPVDVTVLAAAEPARLEWPAHPVECLRLEPQRALAPVASVSAAALERQKLAVFVTVVMAVLVSEPDARAQLLAGPVPLDQAALAPQE